MVKKKAPPPTGKRVPLRDGHPFKGGRVIFGGTRKQPSSENSTPRDRENSRDEHPADREQRRMMNAHERKTRELMGLPPQDSPDDAEE